MRKLTTTRIGGEKKKNYCFFVVFGDLFLLFLVCFSVGRALPPHAFLLSDHTSEKMNEATDATKTL